MAFHRDFTNFLHDVNLVSPQVLTGSGSEVTGSATDLSYCRDGLLLINLGAIDAATTIGYQIQTCDTSDGTYADVLSADGSLATANANTLIAVALSDLKRYVKFQYTITNAKTVYASVIVLVGNRPVNPPA